ncbi:MAG: trigger factor [Alphaproteobacteria bacterium]|nr:trigger factor [Alphaproteobacteria bacterium]
MQVTETRNEGLTREFTVRIEARDIEEKVDHRLAEVGKGMTLPGFRPGKAPLALLQKRYGKAVIGEILEAAVQDSSTQAIAERGLTPAIQPRIEITNYEDGADLEYTMQVELMPEFEPADFSKIELERVAIEVSDAEVDDALARIARENRMAETVAKPRKAKLGDVAVIDFVGRADGSEFPGGAGKDFHLELGSGRFIPGFEEQIVGARPGDQLAVNVRFPEEYNAPDLAGKDAEFEVTVRELRKYVDSSLDDALAATMGFEDLSKLRAAVRENLEREYSAMSRTGVKRRLLDKLAELHDFDVPAGMVDAEFGAIWGQFEQAREQGQIDDDDVDKSDDDLKAEYRAIAERRVRLGLLLSEVGRRNNVEITQDEINRAIMAEAQRYPAQQREVVEHYQNHPEALAQIRAPLFENKVTDFILEIAKVRERSGTMEDLLKAEESEAKNRKKPGKKAKPKKPAKAKDDKGKKESDKKAKAAKPGGSKKQAAANGTKG